MNKDFIEFDPEKKPTEYKWCRAFYRHGPVIEFVTDGTPSVTARSMGKYYALEVYHLVQDDSGKCSKKCDYEGPSDTADSLEEQFAEQIATARRDSYESRYGSTAASRRNRKRFPFF